MFSMGFYSLSDLLSGNPVHINNLKTDSLQQLHEMFCENVYVYELSDGNRIRLFFSEDQFCHLIGFSYFGYQGINGWNTLKSSPIEIRNFSVHSKYTMLQYRISHYNKIYDLLNSPDIYIYKASDHPKFRYQSIYFAVYEHRGRWCKLGIGLSANSFNYPETYLVDKDLPTLNYYLAPANLLTILSKKIITRDKFSKMHNMAIKVIDLLTDSGLTTSEIGDILTEVKRNIEG